MRERISLDLRGFAELAGDVTPVERLVPRRRKRGPSDRAASITMTFDTCGHTMPGGIDEVAAAANDYLDRMTGERSALAAVGS